MRSPMVARRCPVAAIAAALTLTAASTASAGGVTKLRAESVAKRAASARVEGSGSAIRPGRGGQPAGHGRRAAGAATSARTASAQAS
jgi:hypothetical protein